MRVVALLVLTAALVVTPVETARGAVAPERTAVALGAAVDVPLLAAGGRYAATFLAHHDQLTPENAMKMEPLRPGPDRYDFQEADRLVTFALEHGLAVAPCDRDFARFPAVRWFDPLARAH